MPIPYATAARRADNEPDVSCRACGRTVPASDMVRSFCPLCQEDGTMADAERRDTQTRDTQAPVAEGHLTPERLGEIRAKYDGIYHRTVHDLLAHLDAVTRERDADVSRLQAIIERERTWSDEWITRVRAEIGKRRGISESRGSYAWDDDEYMKEFGSALDAIQTALEKATRDTNCRDLRDCPTTQSDVEAARRGLFAFATDAHGVTAEDVRWCEAEAMQETRTAASKREASDARYHNTRAARYHRIAAALATHRVAEGHDDTKRLDWLAARGMFVQFAAEDDGPLVYAVREMRRVEPTLLESAWPRRWYDSPRAAIDAAMAGGTEGRDGATPIGRYRNGLAWDRQ